MVLIIEIAFHILKKFKEMILKFAIKNFKNHYK